MWESTFSLLPHDTVGEVDTGGIEGRGRDLVAAHPDVGFNHPWTGLTQNDLGVSGAEPTPKASSTCCTKYWISFDPAL